MANLIQPITAQGGFAITESDDTVFNPVACALYIGTGGDVVVRWSVATRVARGGRVGSSGHPCGVLVRATSCETPATLAG